MPEPLLVAGAGTLTALPQLLARWRPGRVLLVGSRRAVTGTGVLGLLGGAPVSWFEAVRPNPSWQQAAELVRMVDAVRPDVVVGIGGGSTLDTAKIGRLVADPSPGPVEAGRTPPLRTPAPGLVLVPTTAGSGSEMTRFATVYVDGRRRSVEDPRMLADVALVDPVLTESCPPGVTWPAAFDALAHAAESYWSRASTPASRALAWPALTELVTVLDGPVAVGGPVGAGSFGTPTPRERARLSAAATLAGRAIDHTRTTAAHAFSYWLTARRQVPHGLACLLNLTWVLPYNARHLAERCADRRGPGFVADRLGALCAALAGPGGTPEAAAAALGGLLHRAGWSERLSTYGLGRDSLPDFVAAGIGTTGRAENNPVLLDRDRVTAAVLAQL